MLSCCWPEAARGLKGPPCQWGERGSSQDGARKEIKSPVPGSLETPSRVLEVSVVNVPLGGPGGPTGLLVPPSLTSSQPPPDSSGKASPPPASSPKTTVPKAESQGLMGRESHWGLMRKFWRWTAVMAAQCGRPCCHCAVCLKVAKMIHGILCVFCQKFFKKDNPQNGENSHPHPHQRPPQILKVQL